MEPVFELQNNEYHIKIYANGKVEGFEGTIINRIPNHTNSIIEAVAETMESWAEEIRKVKING